MTSARNDHRAEITDLSEQLDQVLARVARGGEVSLVEDGTAIARVVPPRGATRLERLIEEGLVTPARSTRRWRPKRRIAGGGASDLVIDDRR
ncbi:MAG TPA: prevent-host-death protein [Acidimicrobiia bacterium]|nr:prevent-host-death protein [Acidimicrobiia bacterium]